MAFSTAQLLVDYMYGGFKALLSYKEAVQLFVASSKYDIRRSQLHCERALKSFIKEDTLLFLADLADRHCCRSLQQV